MIVIEAYRFAAATQRTRGVHMTKGKRSTLVHRKVMAKKRRTRPLPVCLKLRQVIPRGPNLQFWIWEDCRLYRSVYAPPFVTTTVLLEKKSFDITTVEWSSAFPYPNM